LKHTLHLNAWLKFEDQLSLFSAQWYVLPQSSQKCLFSLTEFLQSKRTEIKKLLFNRTDRVKAVDFHPAENWIICGLYSGKAYLYDYVSQMLLKTFDVTDVPIRAVRFIPRKNWIVTGSDDFQLVIPLPFAFPIFLRYLLANIDEESIQLQYPRESDGI